MARDFEREKMEQDRKIAAEGRRVLSEHYPMEAAGQMATDSCNTRATTVEQHIYEQIARYERVVYALRDLQRNLPRDFLESPRDRIMALAAPPAP